MIKISITADERKELEQFRRLSSSKDSEKTLMVLLCSEGHKVNHIAGTLNRIHHCKGLVATLQTIRHYRIGSQLFAWPDPDEKRSKIKKHIAEIIVSSPVVYGYKDHAWSVPFIAHDSRQKLGITVSNDTVTRALNSMGYSYQTAYSKLSLVSRLSYTSVHQANRLRLNWTMSAFISLERPGSS